MMKAKDKWSVCMDLIVQNGLIFYIILEEQVRRADFTLNFAKLMDS